MAPPPTTKDLIFGHFANGGSWTSSLFLINPTDVPTAGELSFLDGNGTRIALPVNDQPAADRISVTIPPQGGRVFTTNGAGDLVSGSARVNANVAVGGVLRFASPGLGIAGVGSSAPSRGFITPVTRSVSKGLSTGVAIASGTAGSQVTLTLVLRDTGGAPIPGAQTTLILKPNGQLARFVEELFPAVDTREFEGTLTVFADGGLMAGTAIQIGAKPGELTTLPVSPLR